MAPTIIRSVLVPTPGWYSGQGIYDLIDLATVKSIMGGISAVANGSADAALKLFITQASSAIRKYCNRTFQIQTYQDLYWSKRDPYPWQLPSGAMPLQLSEWPIAGAPCTALDAAPTAPGALSAVAGGTLAAQTCFVRVTYTTLLGETAVSPEANLVIAANNLLQVAAPPADPNARATGWNLYVGTSSGAETRQNSAPLALNASWTMPTTGLQPGPGLPSYISVTLNANVSNANINLIPQNLIEGQDFRADYKLAQLSRLFNDGYPCRWEMLPIQVVYQAGFVADDPDLASVVDCCIRLVRGAYFASSRDPNLRSENIEGVYSAQYWFASGPDGALFPPDIKALLDDWRVPSLW